MIAIHGTVGGEPVVAYAEGTPGEMVEVPRDWRPMPFAIVYDRQGVAFPVSHEVHAQVQMMEHNSWRSSPPRFIETPWGQRVSI